MPITIENRFLKFKSEFKNDTGLEFNKENMSLYMQYICARCEDTNCQVLQGLTHHLLNKIDFLPDQIRTRLGEMLTEHPTVKQMLKNKP